MNNEKTQRSHPSIVELTQKGAKTGPTTSNVTRSVFHWGITRRRSAPCSAHTELCVVFLQAEDCIRAFHVAGVQTCALPISNGSAKPRRPGAGRSTAGTACDCV